MIHFDQSLDSTKLFSRQLFEVRGIFTESSFQIVAEVKVKIWSYVLKFYG